MRVLITEDQIKHRVQELGALISADYANRPLTVLGVLTGSIILLADLIRATTVPLRVALISASSYGGTRTTPGELHINSSLVPDLTDRHILVLDDIFDTGRTMQGLLQTLQGHSPASLRTAVLLWKSDRTEVSFAPDYFGFRIPDEFVVGYGLDYDDEYRQLPFIGVLEEADKRGQNPD